MGDFSTHRYNVDSINEWERNNPHEAGRADSIANYVNGLGTHYDPVEAARPNNETRLTTYELEKLYMHNDLARRIIDEKVEDAVKRGWKVNGERNDTEDLEPEHLNIVEKITEAGQLGRCFGTAAVIIVTEEDLDSEWEPTETPEGGILNLLVVTRPEMHPVEWDSDIRSKTFGKPLRYRVTPIRGGGIASNTPFYVHRSRMLLFSGNKLTPNFRSINDGFDDSVLQSVWESIRNFTASEQSIANIIQRFEIATFKIDGLSDVLAADDGGELIQERMQLLHRSMSALNAALIDGASNEEYSRAFATVTGLDTLWDRLAHSVAKAARMPMTQLFGMSPSGLATDDESGKANWRKQVAAYQKQQMHANLVKYYRAILGQEDVRIEFYPLDETTPKEEAEIQKMRAETRAIYVKSGISGPDELRPHLVEEGLIENVEREQEEFDQLQEELAALEAQANASGLAPEEEPEAEEPPEDEE